MRLKLQAIACILFICALVKAQVPEKKLAIIVTSFNNRDWYKKNLGTIFSQNYSNYRVIYVDDCSTDGTGELVEKYIKEHKQEHRVTLIKNKTRQRALANLYNAVQLTEDDEIVFNHDGDDWFAHDNVFKLINEQYSDPDVWITYGSYINWPTNEVGYCAAIPSEWVAKQLYRQKWWKPGQLRTFYSWLFKQVKLQDLFFNGPYWQGQFFPANADLAIYYPMMEMAGTHFKFIDELFYIRNVATPINDYKANKDVQVAGSAQLRAKNKYPKLTRSMSGHYDRYAHAPVDILILSSSPERTARLLGSLHDFVLNVGNVAILHTPTQPDDAEHYEALAELTPATLIEIGADFRYAMLNTLIQSAEHILLAHDYFVFNRCIDLASAADALERTYANCFHLALHQNAQISLNTGIQQPVPPTNHIGHDMLAWAYGFADSGNWRQRYTFNLGLYRSENIVAKLSRHDFDDVSSCQEALNTDEFNPESIGLCYSEPCVERVI